ncbi:MAG: hypothetical protein QOK25_1550 [Thermoleophilaceae bacterium]|jgi:hypothetical protein|nr:hypothetical protein [Thermoleophilaceae bacterium]
MRRISVVATAALTVAVAGCGAPSGDLLGIQVTGGPAHVRERIRVTDDGQASCGGALRQLSSQQVLEAREVKRLLKPLAKQGASYTSPRAGGRRYVASSLDGSVSFTEGAPGPPALARATLLALQLERQLCRGPR